MIVWYINNLLLVSRNQHSAIYWANKITQGNKQLKHNKVPVDGIYRYRLEPTTVYLWGCVFWCIGNVVVMQVKGNIIGSIGNKTNI